MLQAKMSVMIWVVIVVAILLGALLGAFCLISMHGLGKLLGAGILALSVLFIQEAVGFGTVWVDEDTVESRCLLGRFRIRWDEIERMWRDGSNLNIVFEGNGKRVAIAGSPVWKSPDKEAMVEIMTRKLKERGIEPRLSSLKTLLISNNAAKVAN